MRRLWDEQRRQLDGDPSAQDTVIFYGATREQVDTIVNAGYRDLMTYFGEDHDGLLFFRIPTQRCNSVHADLAWLFSRQIPRMGLDGPFVAILGGAYKLDNGAEKSMEGNSLILPGPRRCDDKGRFPTLAIECGNSESLPRLYRDRDWWFDNSPHGGEHGDVKAVLTVAIDNRTCRFSIELWHRNHDNIPYTVCHHLGKELLAVLVQATGLAVPLGHSGGPLRIPFQDIFLREPVAPEGNFVIEEQDLASLAICACNMVKWDSGS